MIEDLKAYLKNRRVLIICQKFFGYEKRIEKRLQELSLRAVWLDIRPKNSFFLKAILRYAAFLYKYSINRYYEKSIKDTFDILFIIDPDCLYSNNIEFLKKKIKTEKTLLYMWDSFENRKRAKRIINLFDKIFTFDHKDAKKYNLIFRPLFFSFDDKKIAVESNKKIDISFIGTGHSDRLRIIKAIENQCKKNGISYFFYIYLQSPIVFYFYKLFKTAYRGVKKSEINYVPLDYNNFIKVMEESTVIVDLEHPGQRGLTIRTLESLGKSKKMITTNQNIKEYDFYNHANICIIDRNNPIIDPNFFNNEYKKLPEPIYYKYSLDSWLEDIFCNN
jgi:hypothetical protein